jgi:hypothetical protein
MKKSWKQAFSGLVHTLYFRCVLVSGVSSMVLGIVFMAKVYDVPQLVAWISFVAGFIAVVGSFIKEGSPIVKSISQKLKGKDTELTITDRVKQEEDRMFVKR